MKKITLNKKNGCKYNEETFLNPDNVYIYNVPTLCVKKGETVKKGDTIIKNGNYICYSPISGQLKGIDSDYLVIENDFKETQENYQGAVKYICDYDKKEALNLIKNYYNVIPNDSYKIIIVNGIDEDPFVLNYSYIIDNYCSKILEATDALANILGVDNTIITVNANRSSNVLNLTNHIGTYPNMKLKLTSGSYPNGFRELVVKNSLNKKQQADSYLYLTVQDVYNIYNVLKKRQPLTENIITVAGNALESAKIMHIKLNSSITDIIAQNCDIIDDKYYVVLNGLIAGDTLDNTHKPATIDIKAIFLTKIDESVSQKCINCGLCNAKCPVGLNPKYIREHKKADRSKCINCGLCTYICPAKINFKPYLGDKDV